jgi:hypothetical protein
VAAFTAAERRDRRRRTAPDPVAVQRRRVAGTGAVCVGLLGAILLVEHYAPGTWDGVLRGLVVTVLVALMGLVVVALVLAGRTDRAEADW